MWGGGGHVYDKNVKQLSDKVSGCVECCFIQVSLKLQQSDEPDKSRAVHAHPQTCTYATPWPSHPILHTHLRSTMAYQRASSVTLSAGQLRYTISGPAPLHYQRTSSVTLSADQLRYAICGPAPLHNQLASASSTADNRDRQGRVGVTTPTSRQAM